MSEANKPGLTVLWGASNAGKTTIAATLADPSGLPIRLIDHDDGSATVDYMVRSGAIEHRLLHVAPGASNDELKKAAMGCILALQEAEQDAIDGKIGGIILDGLSTLYQEMVQCVKLQNLELALDMSIDKTTAGKQLSLYRGPASAIDIIVGVVHSVCKRASVPVVVILHSKMGVDKKFNETVEPAIAKNGFQRLRQRANIVAYVLRYPGRPAEMEMSDPQNKFNRVRGGKWFEARLQAYIDKGGELDLREIFALWAAFSDQATEKYSALGAGSESENEEKTD